MEENVNNSRKNEAIDKKKDPYGTFSKPHEPLLYIEYPH